MKKYRILVFDPGLSNTGWGIITYYFKNEALTINEVGTEHNTAESRYVANKELVNNYGTRVVALDILRQHINEIFEKAAPDYVVTEDIFINKNPKYFTAYIALSQWMTILRMYMYEKEKKVYEIPTKTAKHCVAKDGGAGKENIQEAIYSLPKIKFKKKIKTLTEHEADAIAIGYTFCQNILPDLVNQDK